LQALVKMVGSSSADIPAAEMVEILTNYRRRLKNEQRAKEIFNKGFKGYEEKLLNTLAIELLQALVKMMPSSSAAAADLQTMLGKRALEDIPAAELTKLLLMYKRRGLKPPNPPAPQQLPGLFTQTYAINIIAWNSLKLRVDDTRLQPYLHELASCFAKCDVLALQEILASKTLWGRVTKLKNLLEKESCVEWTMAVSEKNKNRVPEVHIVLARSPITILRYHTITEAGGVPLDNPPLIALLDVSQLVGNVKYIAVTSVHLPPAARADDRDRQIRALLSNYAEVARDTLKVPFTDQGAKDARCLLLGDL